MVGLGVLLPSMAWADEGEARGVVDKGVTGVWVLANISYAGMRAQNNPAGVWRVLAFLGGLPGTLLSYLAIREGSNRAYGVVLTDPATVAPSWERRTSPHKRAAWSPPAPSSGGPVPAKGEAPESRPEGGS